jgi:hypothetical protein
MEEILASIRQIISEDGSSSAPKIDGVVTEPSRGLRAEETGGAAHDRASQAEAAEADEEPSPAFEPAPDFGMHMRRIAQEESAEESEPEYAPEPLRSPLVAPRDNRAVGEENDDEPLLSERSGEAVSGAFGALANTLLAHNHTRTLEGVVTEMLQPMLKQWLDDNLPAIVERKVQEEIERVSRGRR